MANKIKPRELKGLRKLSDNPAVHAPKARWRWIVRQEWAGTTFTDRFLHILYHGSRLQDLFFKDPPQRIEE